MPLTEQRRQQLDGIVQQMTANNETDENIRFVVGDFKGKYEGERAAAPAQVQPEPTMLSKIGGMAKSIGSGLLEGAPVVAGGALGGALGASLGPAGIAGGAALGAGTASAFQDVLKRMFSGEGPPSLKEASIKTLTDAAGGMLQEAGPAVAANAIGKLASPLRTAAEKQMGQVFAPTTKVNKFITKEKIVPGMLERGETAMTQKGLLKKAGGKVISEGEKLEKSYDALPQNAKTHIVPIFNDLEKAKAQYIVKGTNVIGDEAAYKNVSNMQDKLLQIADTADQASVESLRSLRQIWEGAVADAGGYGGKDIADKSILKAQKAGADAIRRELAARFPDIAKINGEFSFWRNVQEVLGETAERQVGQALPLGSRLAHTAGGVVGAMGAMGVGGGAGKAIVGGFLTGAAVKNLNKLVTSTGWRTVNAQLKNTLAESLAAGNSERALLVMARIGNTLRKSDSASE